MFTKSERLSYRSRWRTACLRTLCGLANAWGGTLYIGVNPEGEVTGLSQEYCEFVLREIPGTIREALHIIPEITVLEEGDLRYIAIKVGRSYELVSYKDRYYVRNKTVTRKMPDEEAEKILLDREAITWDVLACPFFEDRDLDSRTLSSYRIALWNRDRTEDGDGEFLESLHLKKGNRYTNAAALMFTEHPEYWIKEAYIRVGFLDEDGNVLHEEKVTGPLQEQAWGAKNAVLARYMRLYRKPMPLPVDVLEDALLNAVIHKDYSKAQPIQVRVSKDSVRIINSGGLPGGWNLAALEEDHVASPRNPLIAELFALAGYAGGWGMGITRMRTSCEKAGLPAPRYSVSSFGFSAEFALSAAEGGA